MALSLPGALRGYGALDLYLTHPVGLQLSHAAAWTEWTEVEGPPWTNTEPARQRERVWMANGMVSLALGLEAADALAVLASPTHRGRGLSGRAVPRWSRQHHVRNGASPNGRGCAFSFLMGGVLCA